MPPPTRQNGLMLMPGINKHYPSFVVEVAYKNETMERLLSDASEKYFTAVTSVRAWLGIKINDSTKPRLRTFWAARGVRAAHGIGMVIRDTTTDANGNDTVLPVDLPANRAPLLGQFSIPSAHIYHPHIVPPAVSQFIIIPFEEVRFAIKEGFL